MKMTIKMYVAFIICTFAITITSCTASKQHSYTNATKEQFNLFDGVWHSTDYNYTFKIKDKTGVAVLSNSSNYHAGDLMLRIQNPEGDFYHGQQIYVDGAWHDVILKMIGDNKLWMKGGAEWIMTRQK